MRDGVGTVLCVPDYVDDRYIHVHTCLPARSSSSAGVVMCLSEVPICLDIRGRGRTYCYTYLVCTQQDQQYICISRQSLAGDELPDFPRFSP